MDCGKFVLMLGFDLGATPRCMYESSKDAARKFSYLVNTDWLFIEQLCNFNPTRCHQASCCPVLKTKAHGQVECSAAESDNSLSCCLRSR